MILMKNEGGRIMNKNLKMMDDSNQSTYNYVSQKLKSILHNCLELQIDKEDITLDSNLTEYGLNSVTFIKIVVAIENELEFEFEDEDLDSNKFITIRSIVDYVMEKRIL